MLVSSLSILFSESNVGQQNQPWPLEDGAFPWDVLSEYEVYYLY